jgi:hypothetical protein
MTRGLRRHRTVPAVADSGSLPFAMFISLLGVTLSALLIPVIVLQIGSSRSEARRVESVQAAQTGLDVATAHVRAAYTGTDADGDPQGDVTKLPCAALTGDLGGGSAAHYRVTIDYFAFEPATADYLTSDDQYDDGWIAAHSIACGTGVPVAALIRAQGVADGPSPTGTCTSDTRCLRALYTFTTTDQAIDGGLIHVYKTASSNDLCLAAGYSTLTAAQLTGTALTVQTCNPVDPAQNFAYQSDLTVALVGSRGSDLPNGMCLDSRAVAGQAVEFDPCAAADQATQHWVFTGSGAFVAPDGTCLRVLTQNQPGSLVVHDAAQCGGTTYNTVADFTPAAAVGAGAAGWPSGQLVSYRQFGRCLEVTRADYAWHTGSVNPALSDGPYLISSACKQTSPAIWSQTWALSGAVPSGPAGVTGPITATAPGTDPPQGSPAGRYCLQSPASADPLQFVRVVPCPSSSPAPAHTTWTVTGYTGDSTTSYLVRDDNVPPYCLAPQGTAARSADPYPFTDGTEISKIVVQPCDGSAPQKWNVPPGGGPRVAVGRIGEK